MLGVGRPALEDRSTNLWDMGCVSEISMSCMTAPGGSEMDPSLVLGGGIISPFAFR